MLKQINTTPFIEAPKQTDMPCPLCHGTDNLLFHQDNNKRSQRPYYRCSDCALVYVPNRFYLSPEQEKAEYDLHENQLADEGYRQFLNRFWFPLKAQLKPAARVLEFGCGPGPLLAKMMTEDGFKVSLYDHFYQPDASVLQASTYDAITSTEVIEHVFEAKGTVENWLTWLKPKGTLAIMTKLVSNQQAFANWHYKNDLTHVCFYSTQTFEWIAAQYGLTLECHGADVMLLHKA